MTETFVEDIRRWTAENAARIAALLDGEEELVFDAYAAGYQAALSRTLQQIEKRDGS